VVPFGPEERERLLALLLRDGILYASDSQPVRSRDGKTARWMLDSLGFSLRAEGGALAGRALLSLLGGFEGRQVATYGTTAIPLLSSCVALAGGRLNGLLVRKERKPYGSSKKIEGKIDRGEPTILLDDSIASGTNAFEGIAALEEDGIWVEGAICLVRFGYYGGVARLQERGYQVASVFDIYSDVMDRMADEEHSLRNPTLRLPKIDWADQCLPDGLAPHEASRRAIAAVLRDGKLPRPPLFLGRAYDAAGGLWISLRERREIFSRPARDGFWFFPDDGELPAAFAVAPPGAPRDLVLAAAKVASELPAGQAGIDLLERCAIAVTFFSALEAVRPGGVDNDVYGLVVRSRERPGRMGGALPRMPGIGSAWREFEHARRKNAGLLSFEPYDLFRHRVEKVIEPGIEWQKSGVPKPAEPPPIEDPEWIAPICRHALALALARCGFGPAPPAASLELPELDTLFVSVYLGGRLRGCMGSKIADLEADLANLVGLAACDQRFPDYRAEKAEEVAVTLAFLHQPLSLGEFSPREVMERIRLGEQALMVYQGERLGLLLPSAAASLALDAEDFALEVIDKAGITRPPYSWRRFECSAWVASAGEEPRRLVGALPQAAAPIEPAALAGLQLQFLLRLLREHGDAYFFYRPHRDRLATGLDITRRAHLGWTLTRAARTFPAPDVEAGAARVRQGLLAKLTGEGSDTWLAENGERPTIAEVAFLLLAIAELEQPSAAETEVARKLAATIEARIGRHGRIATHRDPPTGGASDEAYQDFFPGQALLALARIEERGWSSLPRASVELALRYYRHRFRNRRHYGQLSWLMQAGAVWARVLDWKAAADFTFEVAALALEHQHEDGSFGSPLQEDGPGYTSALFLEGLAAAAGLARRRGDPRAGQLDEAVSRGISYLARLTLREEHRALLPNPEWAIGGVRYNELRDEIRIDFVQHALCVLLENLDGAPTSASAAPAPAPEEASA
jgi:orotate phosphoribosyltransferase/AMMECR1 domain-containing protein